MFNVCVVLIVDYKELAENHGVTGSCLLQIFAHVNWNVFFSSACSHMDPSLFSL